MFNYPFRRRNFFIKKEFQGKFILAYTLTLVGLAALITWILSIKIRDALEWHIYSSHLRIERTGDFMLGLLVETNIIAVLAILGLVILISVIIVNRLNHLFYRMGGTLKEMARGNFDEPRQPSSQFQEMTHLVTLIEELKMHYREKFVNLNDIVQSIETAALDSNDPALLRQGRDRLAQQLGEVYLPE